MIVYPEEIMSAKIKILERGLERIKEFGHGLGPGHGYTCGTIAEETLNESRSGSLCRRAEGTS